MKDLLKKSTEKDKIIYFVTVFHIEPDADSYKRIRCWGWFYDERDAESCIKENWTDIYENGYYNLAMIEPLAQGPLGVVFEKSRWFNVEFVDQNTYNITKIDVPERFKSVCGFSYV